MFFFNWVVQPPTRNILAYCNFLLSGGRTIPYIKQPSFINSSDAPVATRWQFGVLQTPKSHSSTCRQGMTGLPNHFPLSTCAAEQTPYLKQTNLDFDRHFSATMFCSYAGATWHLARLHPLRLGETITKFGSILGSKKWDQKTVIVTVGCNNSIYRGKNQLPICKCRG